MSFTMFYNPSFYEKKNNEMKNWLMWEFTALYDEKKRKKKKKEESTGDSITRNWAEVMKEHMLNNTMTHVHETEWTLQAMILDRS